MATVVRFSIHLDQIEQDNFYLSQSRYTFSSFKVCVIGDVEEWMFMCNVFVYVCVQNVVDFFFFRVICMRVCIYVSLMYFSSSLGALDDIHYWVFIQPFNRNSYYIYIYRSNWKIRAIWYKNVYTKYDSSNILFIPKKTFFYSIPSFFVIFFHHHYCCCCSQYWAVFNSKMD